MEASALHAPAQLTRPARAGRLLRLRSDDQLLALFRSGSEPAFAVVHDRYQPRLLAYSRQMLGGSRPDAEDVVQDVFLRAYGALRVSTGPVSLRAWLYRVAHNRCIDQLRRPVARTTEATEATGGVDEDDPSARAQRREDLRQLVVDLRRLPEQQRSALLMRELEGLPYADLAHALGTTVPSVKSLLVRARIGLVEAVEARDTACRDIRADLTASRARGVRASALVHRHLRDCEPCRDYRCRLRHVERGLAALSPGGAGPLEALAKLLGLGGAGSSAMAGVGGTGLSVGSVGAATGTSAQVAALVCAGAITVGGAAQIDQLDPVVRPARAAKPATEQRPSAVVAAAAELTPPAAMLLPSIVPANAAAPGNEGHAQTDPSPLEAIAAPSPHEQQAAPVAVARYDLEGTTPLLGRTEETATASPTISSPAPVDIVFDDRGVGTAPTGPAPTGPVPRGVMPPSPAAPASSPQPSTSEPSRPTSSAPAPPSAEALVSPEPAADPVAPVVVQAPAPTRPKPKPKPGSAGAVGLDPTLEGEAEAEALEAEAAASAQARGGQTVTGAGQTAGTAGQAAVATGAEQAVSSALQQAAAAR